MKKLFSLLAASFILAGNLPVRAYDQYASIGRQADPTAKTLSEIRAAERRKIPLEVAVKAAEEYDSTDPVVITIMVTNLFDTPLLMNRRMLVNHPRLKGEIAFRITGPDGRRCEFTRLITPMALRDEDFVIVPRGMSIQRSVDLSDLYTLTQKGRYKIEAVYRNDVDQVQDAQRAWKGIVRSVPVEIVLR